MSRPAQVLALLGVLDEAVGAQRSTDAAVAACGDPGPLPASAAQDCGRVSSTVHRLRTRLRELPLTEGDLREIRTRAERLLAYDQWMVRQSLDLAFAVQRSSRIEAARLQLNGLGRPADELRRLRDALREGVLREYDEAASPSSS
ncbi:hypothetical protein WN71_005865 [Streptomyces mangrovisoli]|uniref:Uncharacterized protein n=2 Tax=Streptomyces mangrovisoli TaxID=1428628 RepID=A0A1J4P672_9ACTN|nr:hypothetical protein WN71_005865 [Streptomyces mangrovisoli]